MDENQFPELGLRSDQRLHKDNDGYLFMNDGQRRIVGTIRNEWKRHEKYCHLTQRQYVEVVLSALFNVPDEILEMVGDYVWEYETNRTYQPTPEYLAKLCHTAMKTANELVEFCQKRRPKKPIRRVVL